MLVFTHLGGVDGESWLVGGNEGGKEQDIPEIYLDYLSQLITDLNT